MKIVRSIVFCALVCGQAAFGATSGEPVTLNFVNADIDTVIRAVGELTGRNFIIDPRVKGTVNIISAQPVPRDLAYQILLSSLRLQGFSAVEGRGVTKILPEADAKLHAGIGQTRQGDSDRLITQVFVLKSSNASQLLAVIRPIVSPNNAISVFPQANALVVTDYADNIRRIEGIIASMERASATNTAVIPLLYASAVELAGTLTKLLQDSGSEGSKTWIGADARANVLLVRTEMPGRLAQVRSLVTALDQPSQAGANVRVVYLKNADAGRVAQTLRALLSSAAAPLAPGARTTLPSPSTSGPDAMTSESTSSPVAATPATPASAAETSGGEGGNAQGGTAANLVQADTASNALILNVPDSMYRNLRSVIDLLDQRRAQVYVETLVMEVSAQHLLDLGVQWKSIPTPTSIGINPGDAFIKSGLNIGIGTGTLNIPGVGKIVSLTALARALETEAQGNILSNPNVMATDNEKARIEVAQEIPIQTGQYANTGTSGGSGSGSSSSSSTVSPFTTYDRKKVGFKLEIVPQITQGGTIRMKILQEASSIDPTTTNTTLPITNVRAVETAVTVDDGDIIAIGGLIQDTVSENEEKVPLLGDLPLVGWLFKNRVKSRKKTNLLVFLRPTIVRDSLGARTIADERYRYILGESLKRESSLPLTPENAIESLPSGIRAQLARPPQTEPVP